MYADQLSEFEFGVEAMLNEIIARENDKRKHDVSSHIGRGTVMSMSKCFNKVSVHRWFNYPVSYKIWNHV